MNNQERAALIADCKDEIKSLQDCILFCEEFWDDDTSYYMSKLQRQQIALASLEAEPIHEACYRTYYPDSDEESHKPHSESGESCARRIAGEIGGYVEKVLIIPDGHNAYTAPPVGVMKRVTLPHTTCVGWVKEAIQEHDAKWIEAIRAAGGSVKE